MSFVAGFAAPKTGITETPSSRGSSQVFLSRCEQCRASLLFPSQLLYLQCSTVTTFHRYQILSAQGKMVLLDLHLETLTLRKVKVLHLHAEMNRRIRHAAEETTIPRCTMDMERADLHQRHRSTTVPGHREARPPDPVV